MNSFKSFVPAAEQVTLGSDGRMGDVLVPAIARGSNAKVGAKGGVIVNGGLSIERKAALIVIFEDGASLRCLESALPSEDFAKLCEAFTSAKVTGDTVYPVVAVSHGKKVALGYFCGLSAVGPKVLASSSGEFIPLD